jgi:hypothetical protein
LIRMSSPVLSCSLLSSPSYLNTLSWFRDLKSLTHVNANTEKGLKRDCHSSTLEPPSQSQARHSPANPSSSGSYLVEGSTICSWSLVLTFFRTVQASRKHHCQHPTRLLQLSTQKSVASQISIALTSIATALCSSACGPS